MWSSAPQTDYGSVPTKETSADKPAVKRDQIAQLIRQAESSDCTWKILGMLGGVAMICTGTINFTQEIYKIIHYGNIKVQEKKIL